ncbi:MAG: DUF1593 domain-containing protein [Bacteroidota bacterium]
MIIKLIPILFLCSLCYFTHAQDELPRVIVSTDIGGSDPDDFQSMVHFLVYADRFHIEGLISSPPHNGRIEHIHEAIATYTIDYQKLKQHGKFPSPKKLLKVTKQGATGPQTTMNPEKLSEGAEWIIKQALKKNDNPLYILVWGSITDVAQAVHHEPIIKEKIRVYYIGSWNTKQDSLSRNYLFNNHPDLWWIENNSTFRGMYMGGEQGDDLGNLSFVEHNVKNYGALGKLFWEQKKDIKMGDTPSVLYLLHGNPAIPEGESWGGAFVKTPHGANYWTDDTNKILIENNRPGAKTVNKWRKDYLTDWKKRMQWLKK